MQNELERLPEKIRRDYEKFGPSCSMVNVTIKSLSDYLAVFSSVLRPKETFWFRGHADMICTIAPSVLRYKSETKRANP